MLRWILAGLLVTALVLAAQGILPGDPLFYLGTAVLIGALWYFADRGGRVKGPVAQPVQALALLAAVLLAIWLFDTMLRRLI